jgi:hypothetical protein
MNFKQDIDIRQGIKLMVLSNHQLLNESAAALLFKNHAGNYW